MFRDGRRWETKRPGQGATIATIREIVSELPTDPALSRMLPIYNAKSLGYGYKVLDLAVVDGTRHSSKLRTRPSEFDPDLRVCRWSRI